MLLPDEASEKDEDGKPKKKTPVRRLGSCATAETVRLLVPEGRGNQIVVPESAAPQRKGGGLMLETHARLFTYPTPDGNEQVRALTVFLVNRRSAVHRFYADVSFVFQARLELACTQGFRPGAISLATIPAISTCAWPICTIAMSANGPSGATLLRLGRRRGVGGARDPRLDRSAAAGRSRAGRAE